MTRGPGLLHYQSRMGLPRQQERWVNRQCVVEPFLIEILEALSV